MSTEFIITICTMLIGFLSIILTIVQMNTRFDSLNTRFDSLRTEFKEDINNLRTELKSDNRELRSEIKSDMNTLEVKLNTLILGLFRSYQTPEQPPKQDQN